MGRTGVNYFDIVKSASTLKDKGINPTVDNVRGLLGTGSKSTIGPYLKQWRNKQEQESHQEEENAKKLNYQKLEILTQEISHLKNQVTQFCTSLDKDWLEQRGKIMALQEEITLTKIENAVLAEKMNTYLATIRKLEGELQNLQHEKIGLIQETTQLRTNIKRFEIDMKHIIECQ